MSRSQEDDPVNALAMSEDIQPMIKKRMLNSGIPSQKDEKIYRQFLSGLSVQEIARRHNYKQCHVQEVINYVQRWSNSQIVADIQGKRGVQADRYNNVYREAMRSWEKSKKPKVTRRKGSSTGGEHGGSEYEDTTTQEMVGDVQFLKTAIQALTRIDDLYGLDAPKKTALTNAAGNGDPKVLHGVLVKNAGKLSDEELQQIIEVGEKVDKIIQSKQQEETES